MSLDVYLNLPGAKSNGWQLRQAIFIREDGQQKEITRAEWDERFPGAIPVAVELESDPECVFDANITHNLNTMADAAGIYRELWRPEEIGITTAGQLIEPLAAGLAKLESDPAKYKEHNPDNGWGTYEGLVRFVRKYLDACREYPEASVSVSR